MKSLLLLTSTLICSFVFAQKKDPIWFNLEPKIGVATTLLLNNNINNDQNIQPVMLNMNLVYGAGLGIQFTKKIGTQIEVLKSGYSQAFNYKDNITSKNSVKINTTDLVFLIRGTSDRMGYSGFGIKQSFVSNVTDGNNIYGDVSSKFNKHFLSVLIDLGFILYHNNIFDINLNLRLGYALTDAGVSSDYQPGQYPAAHYSGYKATNPASAQLTFNFNWHMGYFATAKCKQKTGFVFFSY